MSQTAQYRQYHSANNTHKACRDSKWQWKRHNFSTLRSIHQKSRDGGSVLAADGCMKMRIHLGNKDPRGACTQLAKQKGWSSVVCIHHSQTKDDTSMKGERPSPRNNNIRELWLHWKIEQSMWTLQYWSLSRAPRPRPGGYPCIGKPVKENSPLWQPKKKKKNCFNAHQKKLNFLSWQFEACYIVQDENNESRKSYQTQSHGRKTWGPFERYPKKKKEERVIRQFLVRVEPSRLNNGNSGRKYSPSIKPRFTRKTPPGRK